MSLFSPVKRLMACRLRLVAIMLYAVHVVDCPVCGQWPILTVLTVVGNSNRVYWIMAISMKRPISVRSLLTALLLEESSMRTPLSPST